MYLGEDVIVPRTPIPANLIERVVKMHKLIIASRFGPPGCSVRRMVTTTYLDYLSRLNFRSMHSCIIFWCEF